MCEIRKILDESHSVQFNNKKKICQAGLSCCLSLIKVALLVIGICATCGVISGFVAQGCAVGLSLPGLLVTLAIGRRDFMGDKHTFIWVVNMISYIACFVFGSLALTHVLPTAAIGRSILVVAAVNLGFSCIEFFCCNGCSQTILSLQAVAQMIQDEHQETFYEYGF